MEARLADLAIPICRLIAAAGIGRSTWADWRAGRTRPRADRWSAATAAFDVLVAEAAPALVAAPDQPVRLRGSSAPTGVLPAFTPLCMAPAVPVPADIDAEVIELAGRVVVLAARERVLWGRCSDADDAITKAMPPRPVCPADVEPRRVSEAVVDGARVTTIFEDPGWAERCRIARATFASAQAEHERIRGELNARHGLLRWEKLAGRASARLARWGSRLATLAPQAQAGLRAKAAASTAVAERGAFLDPWRQHLASSVGADALRIIGAEADARLAADERRDGELLALGRAWQNCADRLERASEARSEAEDCMVLAEWPETLCFNPETDPPVIAAKAQQHAATDRLRYFYPMVDRLRGEWPHDASRARRDEILAAYDAWTLQVEAAEEAAGLKAARRAVAPIVAENEALRRRILAIPASTPGGVAVKVAVACWCLGDIAGMEEDLARYMEDGDAGDDALVCGALLDVVRVMGGGQRATIDTLHPVPVPAEMASPLYPACASSDVVESYRTFLDMELRFLNQEVYGGGEGARRYWLDNPAGRLHDGRHALATSRTATVLGVLGLMPSISVEDRRNADTRAA